MQVFIVGILWILWILTWMAVAISGDPAPRKLHGALLFVYRLVLLGSMFLLVTITPWPGLDVQYRFWDRAPSEELSWAMVAVAAIGFGLAWWATILRLIAHHQIVIESGPFKVVRHPRHLGLIIAAFATAAMFGRPSSLIGAALMTFAFVVKILIDDYALREEATAYDEYAERVAMLLPIPRRRVRQAAATHAAIEPVVTKLMTKATLVAPESSLLRTEPEPPRQDAPERIIAKPAVKAAQLSLTLDDGEEEEVHAAAGLSEAAAKN